MDLFIPDSLAQQIDSFGDEGTQWRNRLPEHIAALERTWRIRVGPAFDHTGCVSWVAPVEREDGSEAILKIGLPHDEARHEAAALRFLDGQGAARLLNVSDDGFSLLLERCLPGTDLWLRGDAERDAVVADLLPRLWRKPAPNAPFITLNDLVAAWCDELSQSAASGEYPADYPPDQIAQAVAWGRGLAESQPESVFLHGDLHPGNILAAQREPWLIIDPKPAVGDPAYDLAQWLFNCTRAATRLEDPVAFLRQKVEWFARRLGLPPERIAGWAFVKAMGWECEPPMVTLLQQTAEPWY